MEIEYLNEFDKINQTDISSYHKYRADLTSKYSWAVPNELAIKTISKYSPLIEIGAGTGYWAKLISNCGAKIICFDEYIYNNPYRHRIKYVPIYKGNHLILNKFSHKMNLFLSWPPHGDDMAFECLKAFKGKYLIYIGEFEDGCTANDKFFNELDNNWRMIDSVYIPQWDGIHDYLAIFKRSKCSLTF